MSSTRQSLELLSIDHGKSVCAAKDLQKILENSNLQLLNKQSELNAHQFEGDEYRSEEDVENRDPAVVASEVVAQIMYLRKLKFQYLEQNAKDKYVKSIVSDIDDAPIVTAEQNKELAMLNEEKKEKLKIAKAKLAESQNNIRMLAPMVEDDYSQVKKVSEDAASLSQKIIEARTSLMLLRQTHPHPRLTIPLADQKLADQVTEMQSLNDQVQNLKQKVKAEKARVKTGALEEEKLRIESAEAQKSVNASQMYENDSRLIPLYDWFSSSLALQRSICNLEESHALSDNELRLTYKINLASPSPHLVAISLIFAPDTRRLAAVQTSGLDELGIEAGDVIDAHVQVNDVHGLVAAILSRARTAASLL